MSNNKLIHLNILISILEQLYEVLNIMSTQKEFRFYSSSLLIVYEGDPNVENFDKKEYKNIGNNLKDQNKIVDLSLHKAARVYMIDFGHVFAYQNLPLTFDFIPKSKLEDLPDENYVRGVKNLIEILESYLKRSIS